MAHALSSDSVECRSHHVEELAAGTFTMRQRQALAVLVEDVSVVVLNLDRQRRVAFPVRGEVDRGVAAQVAEVAGIDVHERPALVVGDGFQLCEQALLFLIGHLSSPSPMRRSSPSMQAMLRSTRMCRGGC